MNISANSSNAQMKLVIEIKSSSAQRIEKVILVPGQDVMIGRAWENQVVIHDKYVDPCHLSISIDDSGSMFIEDKQSKNGTWLGKQALTKKMLYQTNQEIRIGETYICIFPSDTIVSPALDLDFSHTFKRKFCSISSILGITALALLVFLASLYIQEAEELKPGNILTAFMGFGVITILWSLFSSFMGKLFRNEMNFSSHWVLVCFTIVFGLILVFVNDLVNFNSGSGATQSFIKYVTLGGLAVMFFYAALSFSTRMTKVKKILIALFISMVGPVFVVTQSFFKEDRELWTHRAESSLTTMSPIFKWSGADSYNKHESEVSDLFTELDKEIEKLK